MISAPDGPELVAEDSARLGRGYKVVVAVLSVAVARLVWLVTTEVREAKVFRDAGKLTVNVRVMRVYVRNPVARLLSRFGCVGAGRVVEVREVAGVRGTDPFLADASGQRFFRQEAVLVCYLAPLYARIEVTRCEWEHRTNSNSRNFVYRRREALCTLVILRLLRYYAAKFE